MYFGLKQGQITQSIDNTYVLKFIHLVSITYITSFFIFLLLSTSNVKMSDGTFCRVEVHMVKSFKNLQSQWANFQVCEYTRSFHDD